MPKIGPKGWALALPKESAESVVARYLEKVRRELETMATNYKNGITRYTTDTSHQNAVKAALEAYYSAMAAVNLPARYASVMAEVKARMRGALPGIMRARAGAPAPGITVA
jgi:ribosomal protein RSM22 (predicted rRNA methylase)